MLISVKIVNLQRKILCMFVNKKEVKPSYSGPSIRSLFLKVECFQSVNLSLVFAGP